MSVFGHRSDEELAAALYGKAEPKLPPAEEPEPAAEEEAEEETEWRETANGAALRLVKKDGALNLIDQDAPLMDFLEKDIDRLEAEREEEERRVEENWRKTT